MKAHVTVLDPQKAYKEVIENADLTEVSMYLAYRYFVMQMMEELDILHKGKVEPTDEQFKECLDEALENTSDFLDDTYESVVDTITELDSESKGGDYTVNFNGTVEELREMLGSMMEHELAANLEHEFVDFAEMTRTTRTIFEWQVATSMAHTINTYGSIEEFLFGEDEDETNLNTTPVSEVLKNFSGMTTFH